MYESSEDGVVDNTKKMRQRMIAIVIVLYTLSIISSVGIVIAIYLFASGQADVSIGATEGLIIISSCLTLLYAHLHTLAAKRKKAEPLRRAQTGIECSCFVTVRLVATIWFAAVAAGVVVAFKQPVCLAAGKGSGPWTEGASCIIHRISVAYSCVAFISSFALFILLEITEQPFHAGLRGLTHFEAPLPPAKDEQFGSDIYVEKGYNQDIEAQFQATKEKYDAAIYNWLNQAAPGTPATNRDPSESPRCPSWGSGWMRALPPGHLSPSQPQIFSPTGSPITRPHTTQPRRSSPAISVLSATTGAGTAIHHRMGAISPVSSIGSSASAMMRRSPLSTMRRASQPDVPITSESQKTHQRAPLPEAWVHHREVSKGRDLLPAVPARAVRRLSLGMSVPPLLVKKMRPIDVADVIREGRPVRWEREEADPVEIDSFSEIGRMEETDDKEPEKREEGQRVIKDEQDVV